ncbi:MAG: hypothetical protein KJ574_04835 [Nanoarchaeota archaeon]|nr:hypothetical protein [Nanoarchaeota archaeon]
MKKKMGKKGVDFPTVIKIVFILLLLLALLYFLVYKLGGWLTTKGSGSVSNLLSFGRE